MQRVLVYLVVAFCLAPSLFAQTKRAAVPQDFVTLRLPSDPQISPDGHRAAIVITEPTDPKKPDKAGDRDIWVVATDGSEPARRFASSPKAEFSPRWSPDGKYLAFISDRGDPLGDDKEAKAQIYVLRSDGGEAERLTSAAGGVEDLRWSPDGHSIAYTARDAQTDEERKRETAKDDRVYLDHEFKYARLFVVTLADRKVDTVSPKDVEVSEFSWSPDGRQLAAMTASTPKVDDVFNRSRVVLYDRATGRLVRTLSESVAGNLEWAPDGQQIYYNEYTAQKIATLPHLLPVSGGPGRRLLEAYQGTLSQAKWLPDSKQLAGVTIEGSRSYLARLDPVTGAVRRDSVTAQNAPISLSRDGAVAFLRSSADSPPDVWVSLGNGSQRRLTTLNPQLSAVALGQLREISWKNPRDGRLIYGVLITPPGFRSGQPYPTVVQIHGGPEGIWATGWIGSWSQWGQLLASNGYVVLLPNPRGSDGQDWRFVEANRDDWGGGDYQDIIAGLDTLVAQRITDPNRVGVGGWSYGGYLTAWTVTQTSRFKAAVVGAGIVNLASMYGTNDIPTFLQTHFVEVPYARWSDYDKHSPLSFVKQVKTPTLVLHGGSDDRVPTGQGKEFYTALKQAGVTTEMVIYPREPHGFRERAHQVDLMTRVLAWYDRFLKPPTP